MKCRSFLSICWVLIFLLSIGVCTHLILKLWLKWDTSPVIVSFAETSTPVWQIPFPAVTVCSETKSRQTVFNFTRAYSNKDNLTEQEMKVFETVSLVCDNHLHQTGSEITDNSVLEILQNVTQPFHEMLFLGRWKNTLIMNTDEIFSPLLTEEGMCFTFNMLDSTELYTEQAIQKHMYQNAETKSLEWSLEAGYMREAGLDTYPNRALGAGARAGLTIVLRAYTDDLDYLCRGPVQGFKILLHNPAEIPRPSNEYFRVPLNQEVIVAVKPTMMTTSEGLRDYSPLRRQCYFPSERQLRFFQIYTQNNCALECITNYTLSYCGCVSFHIPRENSMPICGSGKTKCVASAIDELLLKELQEGLTGLQKLFKSVVNTTTTHYEECNCLPACTDLQYDAETSQADYDWQRVFTAHSENDSAIEFPLGLNVARVNIFFKDSQFFTTRRSELYGETDFMANCGGLLGLFMVFSILSLVEIVYYCTLRVGGNLYKKRSSEGEPTATSFSSEKQPQVWTKRAASQLRKAYNTKARYKNMLPSRIATVCNWWWAITIFQFRSTTILQFKPQPSCCLDQVISTSMEASPTMSS